MSNDRPPNSHECKYYGRKLSSREPDVEATTGYVIIGSDHDDEIYFDESLPDGGGDMLKVRIKLSALHEPDEGDGFRTDLDLEDILRFAAENCTEMYMRVLKEVAV